MATVLDKYKTSIKLVSDLFNFRPDLARGYRRMFGRMMPNVCQCKVNNIWKPSQAWTRYLAMGSKPGLWLISILQQVQPISI